MIAFCEDDIAADQGDGQPRQEQGERAEYCGDTAHGKERSHIGEIMTEPTADEGEGHIALAIVGHDPGDGGYIGHGDPQRLRTAEETHAQMVQLIDKSAMRRRKPDDRQAEKDL